MCSGVLPRMSLALAVIGLAACAPWKSTQGSSEALRGKRTFTVLPLDFTSTEVDGRPVEAFLASEDPAWRATWAPSVAAASTEFTNVVRDGVRAAKLEYAEQGVADVTVRPRALALQTGGYRPIVLRVEVDAVDANGVMLEQIQSRAVFDLLFVEFEQRLRFVSREAGTTVSKWLVAGAGG